MIQKIKDSEKAVTKNHNNIKYRIRKQEEKEHDALLKQYLDEDQEPLREDGNLRRSTD
jgi:hypothetical protein